MVQRTYALAAGLILAAGSISAGAPAAQAEVPAMSGPGFINCPIQQPKAKNGPAPNLELVKGLVRCHKGEKPAPLGQEGAVKVVVQSVQLGSPRAWSYRQDAGNGQTGTRVYPVKATYTVKTLYRAATEQEANWIRVLNLYVDQFGEWRIGSEEPVKSGTWSRINN